MNPCDKCKKKTGCRSCKPKRDWRRHLKKEGRKERGVATRDTAERKTAKEGIHSYPEKKRKNDVHKENERSGNNETKAN